MRKASGTSSGASRRRFLKTVPATVAAGIAAGQAVQPADAAAIGKDTLTCAESVSGVTFSDTEHDLRIGNVSANLENYEALRKIAIDDELDPAFLFEPFVKPGRQASTPARATPHAQLQITNLTGHPAITVNAGFARGLPVGVRLTGRLYDEATVLAIALAYERARGSLPQRPRLQTTD